MKQKLFSIVAVLLMAGCASQQKIQPHDWAYDVQNAQTREAHLLLAQHYEDVARTMDADAAEETKMLAQYNARPHIYGRRLQDLRASAEAMIREFKKSAADSRKMAQYHRQLAGESK